MDIVDQDLGRAARGASPIRYQNTPMGRRSDEIERLEREATGSSGSTSSSEDSVERREIGLSRISTQGDIERHPTELSRIHTAKSQHSGTVGRSIKSRTSKKPLPEFGGGKPYPPMLPESDEYVVDFDGPHDPLHAQNWPTKKK